MTSISLRTELRRLVGLWRIKSIGASLQSAVQARTLERCAQELEALVSRCEQCEEEEPLPASREEAVERYAEQEAGTVREEEK